MQCWLRFRWCWWLCFMFICNAFMFSMFDSNILHNMFNRLCFNRNRMLKLHTSKLFNVRLYRRSLCLHAMWHRLCVRCQWWMLSLFYFYISLLSMLISNSLYNLRSRICFNWINLFKLHNIKLSNSWLYRRSMRMHTMRCRLYFRWYWWMYIMFILYAWLFIMYNSIFMYDM